MQKLNELELEQEKQEAKNVLLDWMNEADNKEEFLWGFSSYEQTKKFFADSDERKIIGIIPEKVMTSERISKKLNNIKDYHLYADKSYLIHHYITRHPDYRLYENLQNILDNYDNIFFDKNQNSICFAQKNGKLVDCLFIKPDHNKLILFASTYNQKEYLLYNERFEKITPERNQGQEKITGVRHIPSTIEQGLSEAAAGISTLSEKSLKGITSSSQNPNEISHGNAAADLSDINDNSNISQNENLSIDRHNRTNNPNLKNLEKVLDAWKQQEMKMENDVSINTTGYNSVWIDNWRIVNGEPVLVADSHKEIGWKIFYEGQPCIENEVNYEFAYIADDNLLQAAGMNIGDVLQLVQDKLGGVCNQIDPKAHTLSAEEYEQHLNKDLRATNKYLEEMEQSGWGYYDTRVNGHKQLPDGTFNANAAAIDFDWIMDDLKNTGQEYLDIVYSIRDAVESANENENIAGTLLRKYDNEYFERKRDDYNKSLPQKHYSPSNLVEQNEEKSVKPQRQQKEITRRHSQTRDGMEW